jgi:hypothetical protein
MGTGTPELDDFLAGARQGNCVVCRVPEELMAQVDAKVAEGVRAWKAIAQWLEACGHEVTSSTLQYHYNAGHHAES